MLIWPFCVWIETEWRANYQVEASEWCSLPSAICSLYSILCFLSSICHLIAQDSDKINQSSGLIQRIISFSTHVSQWLGINDFFFSIRMGLEHLFIRNAHILSPIWFLLSTNLRYHPIISLIFFFFSLCLSNCVMPNIC